MRDHPVDRADPDRERRPVLSRAAAAACRLVLPRRRGDQPESIRIELSFERSPGGSTPRVARIYRGRSLGESDSRPILLVSSRRSADEPRFSLSSPRS